MFGGSGKCGAVPCLLKLLHHPLSRVVAVLLHYVMLMGIFLMADVVSLRATLRRLPQCHLNKIKSSPAYSGWPHWTH